MKKILISIFVSLIALIGGIVFITKNFDSTNTPQRDFIVVKGYGNNLYKYEYPFRKGVTYIEIIRMLDGGIQDPNKIYARKGHSWREVSPYAKAFYDTTVKADFK